MHSDLKVCDHHLCTRPLRPGRKLPTPFPSPGLCSCLGCGSEWARLPRTPLCRQKSTQGEASRASDSLLPPTPSTWPLHLSAHTAIRIVRVWAPCSSGLLGKVGVGKHTATPPALGARAKRHSKYLGWPLCRRKCAFTLSLGLLSTEAGCKGCCWRRPSVLLSARDATQEGSPLGPI